MPALPSGGVYRHGPWPRRVLMTTDMAGGVWQYSAELCRALHARGVEVTLAAMGRPARIGNWPPVDIRTIDARLEWMPDAEEDLEVTGRWLRVIAREIGPDLVHFNHYTHAALPWSVPTVVVGHSCVLSWWQAVKGEQAPESWCGYHQRVRRGLQAADLVVAPTTVMLDALQRHYGPLPAARVIANGRDAQDFPPRPKQRFVFAAGRMWDEAKNLARLDEVAADVEWPVFIAGERRHPDGRTVDARHARLLGRLGAGEMAAWLGSASIYAWPAKYEPFGLTVLEAALAGCALVLGDIPSLRETWDGAALFVAPDDRAGWGEALRILMASERRRAAWARAAGARAQQLTVDRMVDSYLAAYATLLADAGARQHPVPVRARRHH